MAIGKVERPILPASMTSSSKEERLMKVGLFVNTQFPEGFNVIERVPEMIAQVHAAREAGFASLWFPHHWLTQPMQMLQITPVMGYLAAHAQGMTIGRRSCAPMSSDIRG